MTRIKCFLVEPTGSCRRFLRRYSFRKSEGDHFHNAMIHLDDVHSPQDCGDNWPHDDPRWPTHCECGYEFLPNDEWQLFVQSVYCRSDTGELTTLSHPREPGMMWYLDSEYATDFYGVGLDGRTLSVQTPGGQWVIDSRANNCTRPDDKGHRCWVRHGVPPEINVDKAGDTCAAGAGSIMCGNYHGFLRNGYLEEC